MGICTCVCPFICYIVVVPVIKLSQLGRHIFLVFYAELALRNSDGINLQLVRYMLIAYKNCDTRSAFPHILERIRDYSGSLIGSHTHVADRTVALSVTLNNL